MISFYLEDKGMWSFVDGTFCEEDHTIFYLHWGMIFTTLFWVLLLFVLGEVLRLIVQVPNNVNVKKSLILNSTTGNNTANIAGDAN